jgi:RimJ/RimL family protein N-acetyltransferase|tara:strand:- start:278 stop:802 length:525 start_codon:yes stop_codon:yes gene_type:complete
VSDTEVIGGDSIDLRTLSEEHATEKYAGWLNDPEVNKYLETRQVTVDELKSYIAEKNTSSNALLFGIFWKEDDTHIGNLKLEPIDHEKSKATLGILIGDKDYWGKGVATEATNLITQYAFTTLGLKEVNLGVISDNRAAIRVYEKCGFTTFKTDPKALDHDGKLFDQVWMRKTV